MKNREAFEIKRVAAFHNLAICIWSLVMFLGIMYEIIMKLKVCDTSIEITIRMKGSKVYTAPKIHFRKEASATGCTSTTSANLMSYLILLSLSFERYIGCSLSHSVETLDLFTRESFAVRFLPFRCTITSLWCLWCGCGWNTTLCGLVWEWLSTHLSMFSW